MEKIPLFCLAALTLLPPARALHADAPKKIQDQGTPTMAYYTKGRIIYYGYTDYKKTHYPYSSILATDPAYARAHYRDPTMAYYTKGKTIYYAYTNYLSPSASSHLDWRYFVPPDEKAGISRRRAVAGEELEEAEPPVKMRASPVSNREAFEREMEQTKGTPSENTEALLSSPVDAPGFYKRANAYKDANDFTKAIQDYDEVIRLEPGNAYAYYKRGLCYSAIGRMDLASENFRRANEIMSDQGESWSQKSRSWYPQSGY